MVLSEQENPFQLPIAFLERKTALEQHIITDLELLPTTSHDSLYKYVFKPDTIWGTKTLRQWSNYYTADATFLKESQTLLKNKIPYQSISAQTQTELDAIWQEIQNETGFAEKYNYIEWQKLRMLNNSATFLQCLSLYNLASPLISLMMPIFFLILPLLILKVRGLPITIEKYIELLKYVFKKHQLGQIFDIASLSLEKMIYVVATAVFYVLQIYQNIMSCIRFYQNMQKIHSQLFTIRDYIAVSIQNMDILKSQCEKLPTYAPFIERLNHHREVCSVMLKELKQVSPNKVSVKKIGEIGQTMKCFYQLYNHPQFRETLDYSFGLHGYLDNLAGFRENIRQKNVGLCKFKNKQATVTKFVDAYFPALIAEQPVKNSYKLDKHLLITGPNAAGKTTLLKTTLFNIILTQQLGYGFYKKSTLMPYDRIHSYINIPDTSSRDSLFQAEAKRCKEILSDIVREEIGTDKEPFSINSVRHFCVFDELYSGTNPYEAISSAYAFLKYLHKYDNVNFVLTTHFLELCRRLDKEKRMHNCYMQIDTANGDFQYTYKMEKGMSFIKGGIKVLKDLDYPDEIITITNETLKELDI
jgi:hypothetical protein